MFIEYLESKLSNRKKSIFVLSLTQSLIRKSLSYFDIEVYAASNNFSKLPNDTYPFTTCLFKLLTKF